MRPPLEVADVVRAHAAEYLSVRSPSTSQIKVLRRIATCRTAALGGHVDCCDSCGHARISYNSCRDRHCPKCQGPERAAWLSKRLEKLLPVPYFHIVFTMPHELHPLVLRNPRRLYSLLFKAASRTLLAIAGDPKHLGADIGVTAVLHTWGQNLLLHPHLHCVVTGGRLAPDQSRWISTRPQYFAPVRVLSALFRGKFLAALRREYSDGKLELPRCDPHLADPAHWKQFLASLYDKHWVVYAKPPFGGAEQVFRYLGRYTHRVAISNHRLRSLECGRVQFAYRDYAHGARKRTMTLSAVEFLRRFLLHVLPPGFVRIRHYGLFAPCNVPTKLARARESLNVPVETPASLLEAEEPPTWWERFREQTGIDVMRCPCCGSGRLVRTEMLLPTSTADESPFAARASPRAG